MKKLLFCLFVLLPFWGMAQKKEVMPKKKFDVEDAKARLALGTSTIKGVAVAREYNNTSTKAEIIGVKHYAPEGTVVLLFPMTDYFKEYLKMRQKYKMSLKYIPVLSQEAFAYRIEATVGANGEFVFEQMLPGKYYLETQFNYTGAAIGQRQIGVTDYYNGYGHYRGSSPIYQSFKYNYNGATIERAFVEIKKDGEVKNVKL
ncbi:MAG: hypothetical protein Q4B43_09085 [Bacteroidota bacterium]|nr:hypothetical protein [Bacteroidota bacterium]